MLMPFGKYKGAFVYALPDNYLIWLKERTDLRDPLKTYVFNELEARGLIPARSSGTPEPNRVKAIYRELSLQFHPDRIGGDGEAQRALNLFYERLQGKE
jgi:hypothetical protein